MTDFSDDPVSTDPLANALFEGSADCVKLIDLDGRLHAMNRPGRCVMEIDNFAALRGADWATLWPAELQDSVRAAVAVAREGGVGRFNGLCPTAKGTQKHWDVRVTPVPGDDGTPSMLLSVSRDMTGQTADQRAMRESEARFRNMADHAPLIMWVTEADGYCSYLNKRWYEFTGQTEEEALGLGWTKATHPDDQQMAEDAFLAAAAAQGPFRIEYRLRHADGGYRWAIDAAAPRFDADGVFLGHVGSVIDIDERRESENALRKASDLLSAVMEAVPGVVYAKDRDGRLIAANRGTAELVGKPLAEIIGLSDAEYLDDAEQAAAIMATDRRIMADNRGEVVEEAVNLPDGTHAVWLSTKSPFRDADGAVVGLIGSSVDISDRKRAEELLRDETRLLETLNRTGAALAAELDLERVVQMVSEAGVELTGAQFGAYFHNEMDETGERLHLFTLAGAAREDFLRMGRPRATAIFGPTFRNEGVIRSDDILADPRYGQNAPHKGMPAGHLPVRSYLAVSVVGRSGAVLGGLLFGHPEPARFTARHEDLVKGLAGQAAVAIDNARLFAQVQEANETLEQRVNERTAERDRMWNTSPDLMLVIDFEGVFRRVNPAWTTILGYSEQEIVGRHVNEFVIPDDHAVTVGAYAEAATGVSVAMENRYRHKDGTQRWISWTAAPGDDLTYAVGRDVTADKERELELQNTQEQLRQAQKMEAVGQLTGGIAHDFNNLLTGVIGSLEMMQRRMAQGETEKVERYAAAAMTSANRAAALTHRLLAFSRRQPLDPKAVDANRLVTGMEELLRRTIGEAVRLEMVTAGGLWQTRCDPHQLESAILNLAINARDAMPSGGTLTIETCNAHLDSAYAARSRDVAPGQYVCICVTDTGTGMAQDVIDKAFEPFFTTKPIGQGTGLGLSMIYGFARQSEGYAKIYSEVGQGTTIKLYLPRHYGDGDAAEEAPTDQTDHHRSEHGEVVLVVEDETAVRDLVVDVLEELGYRAVQAADGPAGLKILQSSLHIDLLVTDIGLPGLNGRQLADAARVARPDLAILFMTGYAENATLANGFLEPGMQMITKPFAVDALAMRIRDMIESG